MNDISRELRIILSQIPGMRKFMREYYRSSASTVREKIQGKRSDGMTTRGSEPKANET